MKAQTDVAFIIVMILIIAIVGLFASYLWSAIVSASPQIFNTALNSTPTYTIGNTIGVAGTSSISIINNAIVILFMFAAIASALAAVFVESNPIFFMVGIVVLIIEILIAVFLHNIFFSIMQNSFLAGTLASYPYLILLFQYFPIFTLAIGLLILIFTFGKGGGGYGE